MPLEREEGKISVDKAIEWLEAEYVGTDPIPIDVKKLANALGITIKQDASLAQNDDIGRIVFDAERNKEGAVVTLNPLENTFPSRERFTIAHEIGHFALHKDSGKQEFLDNKRTMSRNSSFWDTKEYEANNFAAQLLMPKKYIFSIGRDIIDRYKEREKKDKMPKADFISEMARRFKVSQQAMTYRLKNLKIIR